MMRELPRQLFVLIVVSSLAHAAEPTGSSNATPGRQAAVADRVMIISVDGLRPDLLLRAGTPHMRRLMREGSYTCWARTIAEAVTLPAHISMLTGVSPRRHGVTWNGHIEQAYSEVPTIFEIASQAGLTTAVVAGKTKFVVLDKPGTLNWKYLPRDEPNADLATSRRATQMLEEHRPHLLFVHLAGVDDAGHKDGWGSVEQLRAVEQADEAVGHLLAALDELKLADSTLVILTADHGGAGRSHGPHDARSLTIPWIARGPGVRKDYDLTLDSTLQVNTVDTFATACALLGLEIPRHAEGKLVSAALVRPIGELRAAVVTTSTSKVTTTDAN